MELVSCGDVFFRPFPGCSEAAVQIWRRVERCHIGATHRPGFTIIELVVVIMIGGVLGAVAIPQFSRYTERRAAVNARDAFVATVSQARTAAIRSGEDVLLQVDQANDRVRITLRSNGSTAAPPLDLRTGPLRAEIVGTGAFTMCWVPRGFVIPGCGTRTAADSIVGFASPAGSDTAWARITLGRAERR
jgi:prepilin-type N-terminal cleavage/methylation domain-containing protein